MNEPKITQTHGVFPFGREGINGFPVSRRVRL